MPPLHARAGEEDLPAPAYASSAASITGEGGRARVFQGGFFQDLHNMLDVQTGGEARAPRLLLLLGPAALPCFHS